MGISILFAFFSNSFKVPALLEGIKFTSITNLQLLWVVLTIFLTMCYDFIVNKHFSMKSLISFLIILFGLYVAF